MQIDENYLDKFNKPKEKGEPPHELSDMTELIRKKFGFKGKYNRGFWLKRFKLSGKSFETIERLIEESGQMDDKYNKCGWIVNQLKK